LEEERNKQIGHVGDDPTGARRAAARCVRPGHLRREAQAIYEHIYASYGNDGDSVYDEVAAPVPSAAATLPTTVDEVTYATLAQANPEQFARLMETLFGAGATWALPVERLIAGEESELVEFKTSARWDTDGRVTRKAPAVITNTIAGFANAKGGTVLIGVNDNGRVVGLRPDYETFGERFAKGGGRGIDKGLNWLTDVIISHLGRDAVCRIRVRAHVVAGKEICRIDVPAFSVPAWSSANKGDPVLYERLPNSTRAVPKDQIDSFLADRFGTSTSTD